MTAVDRFISGHYVARTAEHAGPPVVTVAYVIRHTDATILFDTGFPYETRFSVTEGETELVTFPRPLNDGLRSLATSLSEIDAVANCHLHIDHAGGNHRIPPDTPIYTQGIEYSEVQSENDPIVSDALAPSTKAYHIVNGQYELVPGIRLVPTPGHTAGHQSMVVDTTRGRLVLLGQAARSASEFAEWAYASGLTEEEGGGEALPSWLPDVLSLEPTRAALAHDLAIWTRSLS